MNKLLLALCAFVVSARAEQVLFLQNYSDHVFIVHVWLSDGSGYGSRPLFPGSFPVFINVGKLDPSVQIHIVVEIRTPRLILKLDNKAIFRDGAWRYSGDPNGSNVWAVSQKNLEEAIKKLQELPDTEAKQPPEPTNIPSRPARPPLGSASITLLGGPSGPLFLSMRSNTRHPLFQISATH